MLCGRRLNRPWLQLNLLRTMFAYMVCCEQNLQSDNAGHTGCLQQCKANCTNDTSFFMGFRVFLWCFLCCLCMHTNFSSIELFTTELLLSFHISCAFFFVARFSLFCLLYLCRFIRWLTVEVCEYVSSLSGVQESSTLAFSLTLNLQHTHTYMKWGRNEMAK